MTARTPQRRRRPEARTRVFVYGTLLAGERNHHYLQRARLVGPAQTKPTFALHHLGAFPGLVAGGTHAVAGEVYEVDEPTLAALDRLEGHPDFYRRVTVDLADGTQVVSYVLLRGQVEGHPVIASGSWRSR